MPSYAVTDVEPIREPFSPACHGVERRQGPMSGLWRRVRHVHLCPLRPRSRSRSSSTRRSRRAGSVLRPAHHRPDARRQGAGGCGGRASRREAVVLYVVPGDRRSRDGRPAMCGSSSAPGRGSPTRLRSERCCRFRRIKSIRIAGWRRTSAWPRRVRAPCMRRRSVTARVIVASAQALLPRAARAGIDCGDVV